MEYQPAEAQHQTYFGGPKSNLDMKNKQLWHSEEVFSVWRPMLLRTFIIGQAVQCF